MFARAVGLTEIRRINQANDFMSGECTAGQVKPAHLVGHLPPDNPDLSVDKVVLKRVD